MVAEVDEPLPKLRELIHTFGSVLSIETPWGFGGRPMDEGSNVQDPVRRDGSTVIRLLPWGGDAPDTEIVLHGLVSERALMWNSYVGVELSGYEGGSCPFLGKVRELPAGSLIRFFQDKIPGVRDGTNSPDWGPDEPDLLARYFPKRW